MIYIVVGGRKCNEVGIWVIKCNRPQICQCWGCRKVYIIVKVCSVSTTLNWWKRERDTTSVRYHRSTYRNIKLVKNDSLKMIVVLLQRFRQGSWNIIQSSYGSSILRCKQVQFVTTLCCVYSKMVWQELLTIIFGTISWWWKVNLYFPLNSKKSSSLSYCPSPSFFWAEHSNASEATHPTHPPPPQKL